MTNERTVIGSLFQIEPGKPYYCSLVAPGDSVVAILEPDTLYAWAEGPTPEDAIYSAREKLWKGL